MLAFHPEAELEFDAAAAWHERERDGYGALLVAEVTRRVDQAARFPTSGAPVHGFAPPYDDRKFVVRRFRYVLITALVGDDRIVIAVAHTSRAPGYWRDRLPRS